MVAALPDQTLGNAYHKARKLLRDGSHNQPHATPDLDARLLVAAACEVADHIPLLEGEQGISTEQVTQIDSYIARRCRGEPVARILGKKAFWGLDFTLNEHTLVPRPETEGIVEEVLKWARKTDRQNDALRIVDIGTGSGAILISLLTELPCAQGTAVDISQEALDIASHNAAKHGVATRFQPVLSYYGAALDGLFDVIASNPPYIALHEGDALSVEVSRHDPPGALFAGNDGLEAFREIMPWCYKHLAPNGFCIMEHGSTQSESVKLLAKDHGFDRTECVFDMAKLPRFVEITRN